MRLAVPLAVLSTVALAGPVAAFTPEQIATLEHEVPRLMELSGVPGLTLAVVEEGEVVWAGAFGVRSLDTGEAVDVETMFEAASMTKPVAAYVAMRLLERGELSLDTPLAGYLREDRFPDTERYERLTARHVLTHTTGLPNWGVEFLADPGERFGYSGEGFAYLGRVLARISGLPFEELVAREVFEPLGMTRSSMVSNEEYRANGATGHDAHGFANDRRFGSEPNAGATMLTTATDYARFLAAIMNHTGLEGETVALMLEPAVPAMKWDESGPDEHVWWGLGWGLQPSGDGHAYWHWGNNVDLRGYATADPAARTGFVYFANSENGHALLEDLVALVVPEHQRALDWLGESRYDDPERVAQLAIERAYMDGGVTAGHQAVLAARSGMPEAVDIRFLGSAAQYLHGRGLSDEALDVMGLGVEFYPDVVDARVALGDAYLHLNRLDEALGEYRAAGELDPDGETPAARTRWAEELVAARDNPMCMPDNLLESFVGDYGARHITLREHRLYYRRDGRDEYALSPMDEHTFLLEGLPRFRMRFEVDEEGRATKIVGLYLSGHRDESPRDP